MARVPPERDEQREQRLAQLVAGANDEYERISAWYGYLEEHVRFPFHATCTVAWPGSPLRWHEQVAVVDLADVDDWEDQAWVTLGADRQGVDVPLSQLQPLAATDAATKQALADWQYWVARGYHFWTADDD